MRAKKKPAKKKSAKKTKAKRRDTRFKKGVTPKGAIPFKAGNKAAAGHGRPPNIGSPRAMLKRYAEMVAPEKLRKQIGHVYPELSKQDIDRLSWAEVIALAHLAKSASGDIPAATQAYKQIDDSGKEHASIEFAEPLKDAARSFTSEVIRLAQRSEKK